MMQCRPTTEKPTAPSGQLADLGHVGVPSRVGSMLASSAWGSYTRPVSSAIDDQVALARGGVALW